jgi:hypothetical protein
MTAGISLYDGAPTNRALTAIQVLDGGGVDRTITEGRVLGPDGTDRIFYATAPALSASADPSIVSGGSFATGTATTNLTVVTPTGGTAPYSYAWTLVSHTSGTNPTIGTPANNNTTFTQTGLGTGANEEAVFRCTVTDSTPGTPQTATADVSASFVDYS